MYADTAYQVIKSNAKLSVGEIALIKPDIIIIDHYLGPDRGNEICLEVKADPRIKHIPCVLFSSIDKLRELAIESSADSYMTKPFDLFDFLSMVHRLVL
jgi:CheY-like chemotaxis protein